MLTAAPRSGNLRLRRRDRPGEGEMSRERSSPAGCSRRMSDFPELPAHAFAKPDASPDPLFYAAPRFVHHIDDRAVAAVTALYRATFAPGGRLLDLMSSWVSH